MVQGVRVGAGLAAVGRRGQPFISGTWLLQIVALLAGGWPGFVSHTRVLGFLPIFTGSINSQHSITFTLYKLYVTVLVDAVSLFVVVERSSLKSQGQRPGTLLK